MNPLHTPAHQLTGQELANGWKVTGRANPPDGLSKGKNSVCYFVLSDKGDKAFLKAFDYHSHLIKTDAADSIYEVTREYRYERNLLQLCLNEELSHIARIIDHGGVHLEENNPLSLVQYLILEQADNDIRSFVGHQEESKLSWTLNMMHQVTVAAQQLHSINIAHQDIKPANVLVFKSIMAKLGDLGRSTQFNNPSPYDHLFVAGDRGYSPPELLYHKHGELPYDWKTRRLGCDFYMLGNLIHFMSAGTTVNAMLFEKLDRKLWPNRWTSSYDEVFPFVQACFMQCIGELKMTIHPAIASDIASVVKQLCNPRPEERGLPMNQGFSQFSLRRFVSKLNLLHKRNELAPWSNDPISQEVLP